MTISNYNQLTRFPQTLQRQSERCYVQNYVNILIILVVVALTPELSARNDQEQLPSKARQISLKQQNLKFELGSDTNLELQSVPTGSFLYVGPEDETGQVDANSSLNVVVVNDKFWIGKYEVTKRQMLVVFGRFDPDIHNEELELNKPVNFVSWYEAKSFCAILTERARATGLLTKNYQFRLPTEIEWEYACRAGKDRTFGIGDGINLNSNIANFNGAYPHGKSVLGPTIGKTVMVGSYEGNDWGIHDMHGNVWEWCQDSFKGNSLSDQADYPLGLKITTVIRGGSWTSSGRFCQASSRIICLPTLKRPNLGFRVVVARVLL